MALYYIKEDLFMANHEEIRMQANYMVDTNATVRSTAMAFGISKSTVHVHLTKQLEKIDPMLFKRMREVLDKNKAEKRPN